MIILILLHPIQSVPVQSWCFESESVVRIGRSNDNDVIIYSAVVSRHHLELWNHPSGWEIINFGANGTYVDDRSIAQVSVADEMTIRLGNSGPKIRIRVGVTNLEPGQVKMPLKPSPPAKMYEPSKERRTALPVNLAIIHDDTEGALTQTDFD